MKRAWKKPRSDKIAAEGEYPEHLIKQIRETPRAVELLACFL
tara:strand:- start:6275 stop:6400 length:126 start_codon:yes stop_codon:yes gene_type:complete